MTAERERIARDLHDVLGHSLTTITVKTALARRLLESGEVGRARSRTWSGWAGRPSPTSGRPSPRTGSPRWRAAAVGGWLETGSRPEGGYRVAAVCRVEAPVEMQVESR